jgi:gamma-glutamyltranspeptidase/glutathione hydrolase
MFEFLTKLFSPQRSFAQPAGPPIVRPDSIVVALHPRLQEIGHSILDSGGNAFDAFVAVVAAQNVLCEGASSLAGPLGVLVRTGSDGRVRYLDAEFNDPLDPNWAWSPDMPKDGRSVLVPGAPAGLEALARDHGTRPFAELLEPAIRLARDGFPVYNMLAKFISFRTETLRRSEYGQRTFFSPRGRPLRVGQTIRQLELASFLSRLGSEGSAYVYSGDWGKEFLATVGADNGVLTEADLQAYHVDWHEPWTATYRGLTFSSSSAYTYGGLWVLLALKTLEHGSLVVDPHYSANADLLELMVRVAREVWAEPWLLDAQALENRPLVQSLLTAEYTSTIWGRVQGQPPGPTGPAPGSHSYHVIVVDKDGNAVSGTTTIEADPWGEGVFVQGVPLTTAGVTPLNTAPGKKRRSPMSIHFAFQGDRLRFAIGGYSSSVVEAVFQFFVNLIDYGLPIDAAVSLPRFGTFPGAPFDLSRNWLDPRIPRSIVKALKERGLLFERTGVVDTGLGCLVAADPGGPLTGIPVPVSYLEDPFQT